MEVKGIIARSSNTVLEIVNKQFRNYEHSMKEISIPLYKA